MTRPTSPDHVTALLRTHPGAQSALFAPGLAHTTDHTAYGQPTYVNLGVALEHGSVLLIARSVVQFARPWEIAMPPADADALARSLRNHATYADPTLTRRGDP
jgi:hypothetical protein